jgi:hypothetical protein
MTQHFTRRTVSAEFFCPKCARSTQHRIDDGHKGPCLYRQFDGYPTGMGKDLQEFLAPITMINGISTENYCKHCGDSKYLHEGNGSGACRNYEPKVKAANGMGCLAAQIVAHFKTELGGIYLHASGSRDLGEEFVYTIRTTRQLQLMVQGGATTYFGLPGTKQDNMPVLYQGDVDGFDPEREQDGYKKLQPDIVNDWAKAQPASVPKRRTRKQA